MIFEDAPTAGRFGSHDLESPGWWICDVETKNPRRRGEVRLALVGVITTEVFASATRELAERREQGRRQFVLDFSRVERLEEVPKLLERIRALGYTILGVRGGLAFENVSPELARQLTAARLTNVFPIRR